MAPRKPLVIAHRGDTAAGPENTLPAFAAAIDAGADGIELDVHPSRDGAPVVHHDYYLERTTNGAGLVTDHTLAELRALDAGAWFGEAFAGERLPTLEEVLSLAAGRVRLEIELKGTTLAFLERVLEAIRAADAVGSVELTTGHRPLLWHMHCRVPRIPTGMFFVDPWPKWMGPELGHRQVMELMSLAGARIAHLPIGMIDAEFVAQLHGAGMQVHGANVNDATAIARAIECDVDQLTTSRLDLALSVVGDTVA
ncbi:MAG: glycerophosphodiester phosphodiesterase family protein [Chloroflexi bacterium]|nr:glycerophosphodiester phosphodiesterase family protein [Chloroflexota bacterium]